MFRPIVVQMAALAESREIGSRVVTRVVVTVRCGEHHPRPPDNAEHVVGAELQPDEPSTTVTPAPGLCVPPAAITEVDHHLLVWPSAALTASPGPAEAHRDRQLAPIDRVEKAMLAPDRQGGKIMSGAVLMVAGRGVYKITRSLKVNGPNGSRNATPIPSCV